MSPQTVVYRLQNDEEDEHANEFAADDSLVVGVGMVGIGIVV